MIFNNQITFQNRNFMLLSHDSQLETRNPTSLYDEH